jgi:DNA replication protein DnaC
VLTDLDGRRRAAGCYDPSVADILALPDCPKCGGSGFVVSDDGGAGTARRCDCGADLLVPRLLEQARIPERYKNCTLKGFKLSDMQSQENSVLLEARTKCQRYVDNFLTLSGNYQDCGILLVGRPGSGKTHLAVAMLTAIIQRYRVRGRFTDFASLIHEIQSTFDPTSPESKHDVLDPVIDAELLVLDELGVQRQPSPFVIDTLYLILNGRYTARKPTIFTSNFRLDKGERSNLSDEDLLEKRLLSPPLISRLREMAAVIALDVNDFRRDIGLNSVPSKVWGSV